MRSVRITAVLIGLAGLLAHSTARADEIVIVSPQDGESVPREFTVTITYELEYADTDFEGFVAPDEVVLLVNGRPRARCGTCYPAEDCVSCPDGEVSFDLDLLARHHTLEAQASFAGGEVRSEKVGVWAGCDCDVASDVGSGSMWLAAGCLLLPRRRRARVVGGPREPGEPSPR